MGTIRYVLATWAMAASCLSAAPSEYRGVIAKVDLAKQEVVVEGRGKGVNGLLLTFHLDPEAQVLLGKKPGKLEDLVVGKRVRLVYESQDGRRIALRIVLPPVLSLPDKPKPDAPHEKPGDPITPSATNANSVAGILRRVALTDREIVIIGSGADRRTEMETTLLVPEKASIVRDQKPIRFDDLVEEAQAVVQFEKRADKLTAKSITVGAGLPPQPNSSRSGEKRSERLGRILQMVDGILQMLDKR